jgi:hypothetical protein
VSDDGESHMSCYEGQLRQLDTIHIDTTRIIEIEYSFHNLSSVFKANREIIDKNPLFLGEPMNVEDSL